MTKSNIQNVVRAHGLYTPVFMLSLLMAGCGADDGGTSGDRNSAPSAAEERSSTQENELIVTHANSTAVSGIFRNATESVTFDIQALTNGNGSFEVREETGSALFRVVIGEQLVRIEVSDTVGIEGRAKDVIRAGGPRWDAVRIDGDLAAAARFVQLPRFDLVRKLPTALSSATDASVFAPALVNLLSLAAAGVDPQQESEEQDAVAPGLQEQRPGAGDTPVGDGLVEKSLCTDGCSLAATACWLACITLPFGIFWCHVPCDKAYWDCYYGCGG